MKLAQSDVNNGESHKMKPRSDRQYILSCTYMSASVPAAIVRLETFIHLEGAEPQFSRSQSGQ